MRYSHWEIADLILAARKKSGGVSLRKLERQLGIGHDVLAASLRRKTGLYSAAVNRLQNFLGHDFEREYLLRTIRDAETNGEDI